MCGIITIPISICECPLPHPPARSARALGPPVPPPTLTHPLLILADGFFFFPDTPQTTTARYFSPAEKVLALSRLPHHEPTKFNLSLVRRVLGRWHVYLFSLIWIAGGGLEAFGTTALHALWMQAQNALAGRRVYSVPQINYYPLGATAVSIVALLGTAVWTDRTGKRWQANCLTAACLVVSASILLAYDGTGVGAKFFAFYLSGVSYAGQAVNFSWANEVMRFDSQERSVVLAVMNVASYAVNIAVSRQIVRCLSPLQFADPSRCPLSPAAVGEGVPCHRRALLPARDDLDPRVRGGDCVPVGRGEVAAAQGLVQPRAQSGCGWGQEGGGGWGRGGGGRG